MIVVMVIRLNALIEELEAGLWRPGSRDRAWSQPPERGYFACLLQETMLCIAGVQTEEGSRIQGV